MNVEHDPKRASHLDVSIDNPDRLEGYQLERVLGKGSKSIVYLATCTKGRLRGRMIALKAITPPHLNTFLEQSPSPVYFPGKSLHHPSLVSVHSSFTVAESAYLVLELCEGGRLCDLITLSKRKMDSPPFLTEAQLRPIVRRIAEGLAYLHSQGIVHGGIAPHNIFLTGDGRAKLGGLEHINPTSGPGSLFQTVQEKPHTEECRISNSMSPESVVNCSRSFAADLWSLGCLIVYTLTDILPFAFQTEGSALKESHVVSLCMKLSPQIQNMAHGLLKLDPLERTSLQGILSHPFLHPSLPNDYLTEFTANAKNISTELGKQHDEPMRAPPNPTPLENMCRVQEVITSGPGPRSLIYRTSSIPRPRLFSTPSSVAISSSIRDTWTMLSSRQQSENHNKLQVASILPGDEKSGPRSRKMATGRRALCEVGNIGKGSQQFGRGETSAEKVSNGDKEDKIQATLPLGLLSPPGTHFGKSLSQDKSIAQDASPLFASTSALNERARTSQGDGHSRQIRLPSADPTSQDDSPVPIPRISPPKCLQVAPLFSQTHKTAQGQLVVMPSHSLLVDLREGERRAGARGDSVMCISPDGREVKVYDAPHLSTPSVLSEPRETWTIDELPERYWGNYTFASKFLESVKKRTPWMVWYTPQAKFTVMSNRPKGDIQASFPCPSDGLKGQRYVSGKLADSFTKMKIKFFRQQDKLEISRYAPTPAQRGRGEWISKSETITEEQLKLGDRYALALELTLEERHGLICLVEGLGLAEAAEKIYMVARPLNIGEKDPIWEDTTGADRPSKPDATGIIARPPRTPSILKKPELYPISDEAEETPKLVPTGRSDLDYFVAPFPTRKIVSLALVSKLNVNKPSTCGDMRGKN